MLSVSCYPCGSGNDFVKAFGGAELFLDIAKLITAPTRKLDLLKVGDRYSNNVVNFGFDTTVAITINKERDKTGHGGKKRLTQGSCHALIKSMITAHRHSRRRDASSRRKAFAVHVGKRPVCRRLVQMCAQIQIR